MKGKLLAGIGKPPVIKKLVTLGRVHVPAGYAKADEAIKLEISPHPISKKKVLVKLAGVRKTRV